MWVCCEQPCAPRLKFRTPERHVVLVDVCGGQDQLRDIVKRDQAQSRVGVERRGERPRRVLADVQNREAVLLRLAGRVLYFTLGRHRSRNIEDDHHIHGGLRGRRVAFDLDEGGVFDALDDAQGEAVLLWGGGQLAAEQRGRVRRRRWAGQRECLGGQSFAPCLLCLRFGRLPGGLATFFKRSLRGTLLRRRGEASGRVVAEVCGFPRAAVC